MDISNIIKHNKFLNLLPIDANHVEVKDQYFKSADFIFPNKFPRFFIEYKTLQVLLAVILSKYQ